ncbi:MAG: hypothetical protein IKY71_01685 [Bacteroidaceae bacterium]|nr:hypothetical protein [Bacteroidaceae bacterium]
MKKLYLTFLVFTLMFLQPVFAVQGIALRFSRSGTDAQSVTVSVVDDSGAALSGATAVVTSSHAFKPTAAAVTNAILCPNVNGNTNPAIELSFTISGVPDGFKFNTVGLDIHALNGGGNYQENGDGVARKWNVSTVVDNTDFGALDNIDIAAGVGSRGAVHKVWEIVKATTVETSGTVVLTLNITSGAENRGCFFGLSEVVLSNAAVEPEPEPEPEPEAGEGKVYYIQWKNTGTNYITENADHYMTVEQNDVKKAQFWMFIPTGNENCYYIKNTATGRYMGSCNLTPASASRVSTTATPVEYYVAKSSATSGEIAGCWYFSSTDCTGYNNENSGPRALNKDGASNYVITWQAGTTRTGSYWKLVETEDLYEVQPFDGCEAIGKISSSYNVESASGKNLTIVDGNIALAAADAFDRNQEWYFIGTGNNTGGWQIASVAEPAARIGIADGKIVLNNTTDTKWKVAESKQQQGYFYFTSGGATLVVDGDSLFRFRLLRSAYARRMQIYNNPCGVTGSNYFKKVELCGEDVASGIVYESATKPSNWHVVYAKDKGEVMKNGSFEVKATLSVSPASDVKVNAYFDWDSDGVFETCNPMSVSGTSCSVEVAVPNWATTKQTRMRLRINSNGLDLAEDEVNGFIYDFHITVCEMQNMRTATVGVNSWERGKAELSAVAAEYEPGTTLTAKATPYGNARFVCWREEGVVVSTNAEYTFTVNHNVRLVAYFTPNTDESSYPTSIVAVPETDDVVVKEIGGNIIAEAGCEVLSMSIYTVDAAQVAKCGGNTISTAGMGSGVYIVSVTTVKGYRNIKVFINGK